MAGVKDVRAGHRGRLKAKFLEGGLDRFTDEEIIELLLTFGTPRKDCKQAARKLLETFGSIRAVFEADRKDLAAVEGVGPTNVVAVKFVHAVSGRFLEQRLVGREYLASSEKVYAYLRHHMENLPKELFKVIYLDSAGGVLALEDVSHGTVGAASVYPREIIERALAHQASGLVFAHNHPSGKVKPSPDDFQMTRRLVHAAHVVDMRVVDHMIIGKGRRYYSFRDEGYVSRYEREIGGFHKSRG